MLVRCPSSVDTNEIAGKTCLIYDFTSQTEQVTAPQAQIEENQQTDDALEKHRFKKLLGFCVVFFFFTQNASIQHETQQRPERR